jgi:hypothetical protein
MPVGAPASALEFVRACVGTREDGGNKSSADTRKRLGGQNRELRTE